MTDAKSRSVSPDPVAFAVARLQATVERLRNMASAGDPFDLGLREAAAFIEQKIIPETLAYRRDLPAASNPSRMETS